MRLGPAALLVAALLLPYATAAQSLGGLGDMSGEAFSLSASPQYPTPRGTATISLLSSLLDLTKASMAATVDGKEIYKGSVRPFSVTLGSAGSVTKVKVVVTTGGTSYTQTLSLRPEEVLLIAEPVSTVPPLYPGKSLVPLEGSVRIIALANLRDAAGKSSDPASYAYAWIVDGVRSASGSGIGKSTLLVDSPLQYRARTVSVTVTDTNKNLVGGDSLTLTAADPIVRIYENDPLLGIRFDRALSGGFAISGSEASLFAAPFSLPVVGGPPLIQWFLNGSAAQTGSVITLRPAGDGAGQAVLSLTASAGQSTTATADLPLTFGAKPIGNLFGL